MKGYKKVPFDWDKYQEGAAAVLSNSNEQPEQLTRFKTNSGFTIVGVVAGYVYQWRSDGKISPNSPHNLMLWVKEPITIEYWCAFGDGLPTGVAHVCVISETEEEARLQFKLVFPNGQLLGCRLLHIKSITQ